MRHAHLYRVVIAFVGLVLVPPRVGGQQPSLFEIRRTEVTRALNSIGAQLGSDVSREAREAVASLLTLTAKPIVVGRGGAPGQAGEVPIPLATVHAFQQDETALLRRKDAAVKASEITKAVETDLTTKDGAYKNSPMGLATLITVEVHTKLKTGTETNGWQVMVLPAPLASFPNASGEAFPAFSSPTSRGLAPGPYVMWAVDPADGTVVGQKKSTTLGSVAGGTLSLAPVSVDVLVPKALP